MKVNLTNKGIKQNSRSLILKEAFKLFLQKNLEKVTVPDLESATGVQRGAIFYHFRDKKALFVEVVDLYFFSSLNIFYPIKPEPYESLEDYIKRKDDRLDDIINWFNKEGLNQNPYISFFHLASQASQYIPVFNNQMFRFLEMDKLYWRQAAKINQFKCIPPFNNDSLGSVFRSVYIEKCFSACYNEKVTNINILDGL